MRDASNEFEAIKAVHDALEPLDSDARNRVVTYIASLLGIGQPMVGGPVAKEDADIDGEAEEDADDAVAQAETYSEFADLYEAVDPKSNGEKALVAGYWLQNCQDAENFTGFAANKVLSDLGHKLTNITDAINIMRNRKPSLILQLKKSGSSRQARKLYKITHEGIKRVEEMVGE
ncbi:MAG: hypothetical protein OXI57_12800 [Rhodospirillales bacterium]|nr:hypothetical protein [Rhodospirillales bacterium]